MGRYSDEQVTSTLQQYLQPGERLLHWGYGVKQPSMAIILPLYLLAVLPGAIATAMLTKEYIVGLTDRRFLVLRVKGKINVLEVMEYSPPITPPVEASTGALFTHIKINSPDKPFVAKFHRLGMPNNRQHLMAIEAALTGRGVAA